MRAINKHKVQMRQRGKYFLRKRLIQSHPVTELCPVDHRNPGVPPRALERVHDVMVSTVIVLLGLEYGQSRDALSETYLCCRSRSRVPDQVIKGAGFVERDARRKRNRLAFVVDNLPFADSHH